MTGTIGPMEFFKNSAGIPAVHNINSPEIPLPQVICENLELFCGKL